MRMPSTNHPIWRIVNVAIYTIALGLCLKFNYSTFDIEKDPRSMLIMAIVAGGLEFATRRAK